MRPDEHKKRKNAAYKKKHGISNKTPSTDYAKDTSTSECKTSKKEQRNKHDGNRPEHQHSHSSKNVPNAAVVFDSSESDSEATEKKSFRRREIVSNWRKYDLDVEGNEAVTTRGESFEKLLSMSGEAMSRFRFKDELEWEEEDRLGDGVEQSLAGSGVLSLDLADIVSSISCIPVHQLLGIDQSLFPTEQLESHIQSVEENRKLYNNSVIRKQEENKSVKCKSSQDSIAYSTTTTNFKDVSSTTHNKTKHNSSKAHEAHIVNNGKDEMIESVRSDIEERLSTQDFKDGPCKETETKVEGSMQKPPHSEASLGLMDDDLDQLLDLDVGQEKTTAASNHGVTVSNNYTTSDSEDTKSRSTSKKNAEKEADELEDWLDSILD